MRTPAARAGQGERLGLGALIGYGLLGAPLSGLLLPLYINVPTYYAVDLGIGFAAVGTVLLLARLLDMLSDPLIGWASDRTRTPLGRRKPWMLAGLVPLIAALAMLLMPAGRPDASYLLFWSVVLYVGATMVNLPHIAMGAELSPDYNERTRITGARESLSALGALAVLALPAVLSLGGGEALSATGWLLILATPIAVMILVLTVPAAPPAQSRTIGLSEGFKALRGNGPFQRLIAAYLLNGIANGLPATLFLVYVEHRLGAPHLAGVLLLVYFLSGVAGVPLWLALSRRWGKHRAWLAAVISAAAVFAFVPLLGTGDIVPFLIITVLTGLCLGGDLALPPSMQADVVDFDTALCGARRAGLYFALWNVATKLALALAVGISFPALALLGFDAPSQITGGSLLGLSLLYALLPAALKLGAGAIIAGYRFDSAALAEVRARIDRAATAAPGSEQQRQAS